jgi:hypothetical protein
MADTEDRKPKSPESAPGSPPTREAEPQSAPQPRAKVDLAEPETLSVVVVDTPVAEPVPETRVEVPVRVPVRTDIPVEEPPARPRVSSGYLFLVVLIVGVLFLSFKNIYQPLFVHVEDSIERRVLGEPSKIYQAPESNPHTHQQKEKHSLKW